MNGLLVGRIRGIDVRVHWSVVIIGWLIAWSLATEVFPDMVEGRSDTAYWTAGAIATVGFFGALLAHELGHSIVALQHGVGVRSITLWVLGGVARLDQSAETAESAIRIAAAGPLVSVACGGLGLVLGALTTDLAGATLIWFGSINLLLAAFNLLPAFPLDGGRIYQAWLWQRGMSPADATTKAARLGSAIGRALVWLGVIEILLTGLLGGLWLMAIGWFIREASVAEAEITRRQSALGRFTSADVMTPNPVTVPATRSIERVVEEFLTSGRHAAYPVVDTEDGIVGLVEIKSVRATPRPEWPTTVVAQVMTPLAEVPVVAPSDTVDVLVRRMEQHTDARALVVDDGELVGIVAPSDVVRLTIAVELADQGRVSPVRG